MKTYRKTTTRTLPTADQLIAEQTLRELGHLAKERKERLVTYTVRLYPSQIQALEDAARRIPGISASEVARDLVTRGLEKLK